MIKKKLKICIDCNRPSYLFGYGRCQSCYLKFKNFKINPRSDKEKSRQEIYSGLRIEYLNSHQKCELHLDGCLGKADQIHHRKGRIGDNLYKHFCAICMNCHRYIHFVESEEAYANGWLIPQDQKE